MWHETGHRPGAFFGGGVAGAGDTNGDGFDDIVVGSPLYDNGKLAQFEGRAYVYLGPDLGGLPAKSSDCNR